MDCAWCLLMDRSQRGVRSIGDINMNKSQRHEALQQPAMFPLAGTLVVLAVISCVCSSQVPFVQTTEHGRNSDSGHGGTTRVLTPEFNKFIEDVLANGTVPGLTLGVVHPSGETEFGAYGRKTEDGDKMTTDVSICFVFYS